MLVRVQEWASRLMVVVAGCVLACSGSVAQAQSWKASLHDADELYDAAEDLHDRAERFQDYHVMPVTAELERQTTELYRLLKRNACATEVLTALNTTGATLEQASSLVALSCHLRSDRKALSELANAQRYFDETFEHIQCALRESLPARPAYRAPTWQAPAPAPTWYQVPGHLPVPGIVPGVVPNGVPRVVPDVAPYGYEVRYQTHAPYGQALPRVRIGSVN